MSLPHYTVGVAVRTWTFDPVVAAALLVAAAAYLVGVRAARRRGGWPWSRTAAFLVGGLGGTVVCTMSSLAVYQHAHLWALAAQLTLLVSLVPVGVALGDPVGLARAGLGNRGGRRLERLVGGVVMRVLTFPVTATLLATTFLCVTFFSGVLGAALRHATVMDGLYLVAVLVGSLASLPLLGVELLPAWCTEPFRLLFAFVDGLVDALPGVLVLTTRTPLAGGWFRGRPGDPDWDVHVAGALMISLSELVALPIFLIVFFRWAVREGAFGQRSGPDSQAPTVARRVAEPELLRPWWETEGLGRRGRDE